MNATLVLAGERLEARAGGTLWWPAAGVLAVGDLHLGRAQGAAGRGQAFLPPYGDHDTLARLEGELTATGATTLLLVGDSFDDAPSAGQAAARLGARLVHLATGRRLIWVTGNHDPRPVAGVPGHWIGAWRQGPLAFRHIATSVPPPPGTGEVSGHYHPCATLWRRGVRLRRRCFLADGRRAILPAFGTYTGGLDAADPALAALMGKEATALLLGRRITAVPMARLTEPTH
ncbi:MAG: ligase-associated DNA damage response endonuclease PdeM [Pseudomonadota bacterium]